MKRGKKELKEKFKYYKSDVNLTKNFAQRSE